MPPPPPPPSSPAPALPNVKPCERAAGPSGAAGTRFWLRKSAIWEWSRSFSFSKITTCLSCRSARCRRCRSRKGRESGRTGAWCVVRRMVCRHLLPSVWLCGRARQVPAAFCPLRTPHAGVPPAPAPAQASHARAPKSTTGRPAAGPRPGSPQMRCPALHGRPRSAPAAAACDPARTAAHQTPAGPHVVSSG